MTSETSSNAEIWREIRDTAFCVVLLTRRRDDFWSLPVTKTELKDTWAPPGTREDTIRLAESFGHASITVSFNALTALAEAAGSSTVWLAPPTLAAIDGFRAPDGGYGTPVRRKDQREINAVPRHTAMGAVSHLLFSSRGSPAILAKHLTPTINWLLDNQLNRGGWPYDQATRDALGYLSTASALAALSLFLDLGHAPAPLVARVAAAIRKGYRALASDARDGAWIGDGTPPDAQIVNSAFALELLWTANKSGRLTLGEAVPKPEELITAFCANATKDGWPDTIGGRPDPVSSISGLILVHLTGNVGGLPEGTITSVENAVLAAWKSDYLEKEMTSWDWQCAARLGAIHGGPLDKSAARQLVEICDGLRQTSDRRDVQATDFVSLPDHARKAAGFALAGGRAVEVQTIGRRAKGWVKYMAPKLVERLVWTVLAIVALAVFIFLFGTDPREILGRLSR